MGEMADDTIDGIYCEQCGEYLGEPVGHPRLCTDCEKLEE